MHMREFCEHSQSYRINIELFEVAVVAAMTTIEIADYCEEQKELQADLDILDGTSSEFDLDK